MDTVEHEMAMLLYRVARMALDLPGGSTQRDVSTFVATLINGASPDVRRFIAHAEIEHGALDRE